MITNWIPKHPQADPEMLGYIPTFLNPLDPRPAKEQFHDNYAHGGGWSAFNGFTELPNGDIQYPEDPPTRLLYEAQFRDELIRVYDHAWVMIKQPDGSFEISRMD